MAMPIGEFPSGSFSPAGGDRFLNPSPMDERIPPGILLKMLLGGGHPKNIPAGQFMSAPPQPMPSRPQAIGGYTTHREKLSSYR